MGLGDEDRQRPRARRARCATRPASTPSARMRAGRSRRRCTRGQCQLNLTHHATARRRRGCASTRSVLASLLDAVGRLKLPPGDASLPSVDGLLAGARRGRDRGRGRRRAARDRTRPTRSRRGRRARLIAALHEARRARGPGAGGVLAGQLERWSGSSRRRGCAGAAARGHPGAARGADRRSCSTPRRRSIPTGSTRRRCCSRRAPTSARRSTGCGAYRRGRARFLRDGGAGRPPARLPGPGIRPRGEHALRQGERRVAVADRPRSQGGGRAVPRAGPERGVEGDGGRSRRARPAWAIADPVLAVRGRQVHADPQSIAARTRHPPVGLGDDAAAPPVRDRRRALPLHRRSTDFHEMRERGDLLEWAEVHGNFYGTPRRPVEQALAAGQDMMFDIDWQGTRADRRKDAGRRRQPSSSCRPRWPS